MRKERLVNDVVPIRMHEDSTDDVRDVHEAEYKEDPLDNLIVTARDRQKHEERCRDDHDDFEQNRIQVAESGENRGNRGNTGKLGGSVAEIAQYEEQQHPKRYFDAEVLPN